MRLRVGRSRSVDALRPEWDRLEATTFPRFPFARPGWTKSWLHAFAQDRVLLRDELWLLSVRDEQGVLRGVAPMVLTERPAIGPVRTRMLRMVGADPNITELSAPICAPDDADAVLTALLEYLENDELRDQWDLLFLNGLRENATAAIARRGDVHWGRETPDFFLELPSTWDELRGRLGRNVKESLRKCYNSLKRDNHAFEFRVLSSEAEVAEGVETFFRLHAARASLTGTVDHLDVFGHDQSRAFLRDYTRQAARLGETRVFQLVIGGRVVATRLAFVLGKQLYLYFSGFDPDWGPYSVMTTTVAEAIKWAIDQQLELVNLSPGRDVSKTRWDPRELLFREAYLPSKSVRGGLVHHAYAAVRDERSRLSRLLSFARRRNA